MLRFLTPFAFAGFALAAPILLLYLLKLRRRETLISSTFLWQQVMHDAEANTPWQRLRRNLLLFLQLLILAALVLTLARPFTIVPAVSSGKMALLIDASASMNARDVVSGTRFDEAKRQALDIVNTMSGGDSVLLVRVGVLPEIIMPYSDNREQLRAAIQGLSPGAGSVDWDSALALAAADRLAESAAERVVILSDGGFGEVAALPGWQDVEWEFISIGDSAENIAISQLATGAIAGEPPQLFASLTNFGERDAERIVSLWLDGELRLSERMSIPAGAARPLIYGLPTTDYRELELRLTVPLAATTPDHLADDDRAFATTSSQGSARVLLISQPTTGAEGNIFLERALASLPGLEVLRGNPAMGVPSRIFDLTVLDGWQPEIGLPPGDLLIINPPRSTAYFQLGAWLDEPTRLRVDATHPITQYVDLSNVSLLRAREIVASGNWADPLIWAGRTPILLAGESEGRRIAVLPFDLRDSDLPLWIAWPVLMANLMEWFRTGDSASTDDLTSGELALFQAPVSADAARVTGPDGAVQLFPLTGASFAFRETERVGIYRLEWLAGEQAIRTDRFAINLFAPAESEIRPLSSAQLGSLSLSQSESDALGQREWWLIAVAAALALLLLEWWLYHRRNRLPMRRAPGKIATSRWWRSAPRATS